MLNTVFCSIALLGSILICSKLCLSIGIVTGDSMLPALHHGDYVIIWRLFPTKFLQKHQIVVFEVKKNSYIKRVIGLSGDKVFAKINNLPLHLRQEKVKEFLPYGQKVFDIPPNHFFAAGDARQWGVDSYYWGPIPYQKLKGIVIMKLVF